MVPNPELDVNMKHERAVTGETAQLTGAGKIIHKCSL